MATKTREGGSQEDSDSSVGGHELATASVSCEEVHHYKRGGWPQHASMAAVPAPALHEWVCAA